MLVDQSIRTSIIIRVLYAVIETTQLNEYAQINIYMAQVNVDQRDHISKLYEKGLEIEKLLPL